MRVRDDWHRLAAREDAQIDGIRRPPMLRQRATPAERLLWARLRDRRLDGFKVCRRRPVGRDVADVVCLGPRLVIEIDGAPHDLMIERDAIRDAAPRAAGDRVLRFRDDEVRRRFRGRSAGNLVCPRSETATLTLTLSRKRERGMR